MFKIVEDFGEPQVGKTYFLTKENVKWVCREQGYLGQGKKTQKVFYGTVTMPDNKQEDANATWNGRVWIVSSCPSIGLEECLSISKPTDWEYK